MESENLTGETFDNSLVDRPFDYAQGDRDRQQNNCQAHVIRCFLRQHDKDGMNLGTWNLEPCQLNFLPKTLLIS